MQRRRHTHHESDSPPVKANGRILCHGCQIGYHMGDGGRVHFQVGFSYVIEVKVETQNMDRRLHWASS